MGLNFSIVNEGVFGSGLRYRLVDATFDSSYLTGGEVVDGNSFGLSVVQGGIHQGGNALSGAFHPHFDTANSKLMMFRVPAFTPAGTIGGNATIGGGAAGEPLGITPDSNAGALTKNAATARTIPLATLLGAAPAFTGTAVAQGSFAEVTSGVNLSAVTVRMLFTGV